MDDVEKEKSIEETVNKLASSYIVSSYNYDWKSRFFLETRDLDFENSSRKQSYITNDIIVLATHYTRVEPYVDGLAEKIKAVVSGTHKLV